MSPLKLNMLERIIKVRGKTTFEKKVIRIAIFVWNLVIYSLPLDLLAFRIINLPSSVMESVAILSGYILNSLGFYVKVIGNSIIACGETFTIIQDCVGYKSILGLFAIIMATPTKDIKTRLKWFLYFTPVMFIINLLRITSTVYLGCLFGNIKFIHNVLWQILTTVAVFLSWLIFLMKNKKDIIEF